jgi:hypothetical protein
MSNFTRAKMRCPVCHGFGVVMGKDFESKPCHNPECVGGWVESRPGPIEAVVDAEDWLLLRYAGDLGGVELG